MLGHVTIVKGASGEPINVGHTLMVDTANWMCRLEVKTDDEVLLSRAVTDIAAGQFVAALSKEEVNSFEVETYTLELTLTNGVDFPEPLVDVQVYMLFVEPAPATSANHSLSVGSNTFAPYANLLGQLTKMPMLMQAATVDRLSLKAACIQAWHNIGKLTVNFGNGYSTTRDFDVAAIGELSEQQRQQLIEAQLIEADFLLGGNPIEQRRRMGLMSDSSGESAHFFRPTKPVVLAVCRDAALALAPYVRFSAELGRG